MSTNRRPANEDQGSATLLIRPAFAAPTSREAAAAPLATYVVLGAYVVLLTVGYYLSARLGLGFRFLNSQIGVVWPANAVLLSALLLTPKSRWWVVLAASAVAHFAAVTPTAPVWRVLWQIVCNSIFTVGTAEVLRRFAGLPLHFASRRQVFVYIAVSIAMPALFGFTTPAFVRSILGLESTYTSGVALLRTALSNATAMMLVAPAILLWAQCGLRLGELRPRKVYEAAAIMISLLAVGLLTLGSGPELSSMRGLLLWVFPPLLWAAVRFGPLGASTSLFTVAALSLWATSRQLGPFVLSSDADYVLSLQLFWMALCPPVMLLAATIRERDLAEHDLQNQRNQLAHVTRVAIAGEMSAALAHELRQPLTSILASAEAANDLLAQRTPDLGDLREILREIVDENKQAAGIIARVQSFMRKDEPRFEALAVEAVVRDALALARHTIAASGVEVEMQIVVGLPRVHGDRVQLLQVVLNLIVNACESMTGTPALERHLRLQVARTNADRVEVLVVDRGAGLPVGAEDRVFEAFYTTKENGLGLGLAISRSIAAAHGGQLWGENNPQGGATFHLALPTETSTG